eukprot:TRINITY_DN3389_c0_g1_i1.p1 TRINITY_DN3389_c0_g1~~TRINITY_DN3389_c0_g1_i1.p1  ORF type:complete len:450 (-),score=50.64 TRINITY_DN3389_c0_g1_i1:324-1673(-)
MQQSNGKTGRLHFPTTSSQASGRGEKSCGAGKEDENGLTKVSFFPWWDERCLTNTKYNLCQQKIRKLHVTVDLDCEYVRMMVVQAFQQRHDIWDIQILQGKDGMDEPSGLSFQSDFTWSEYERVHWEKVLQGEQYTGCYCVRKGLIRKAHLAFNIKKWVSKRGAQSKLAQSTPLTLIMDLPDIEYFEEAMADLPEVRGIYLNGGRKDINKWIAKPSLTNQATSIFIFSTEEQLRENLSKHPCLREWVIQEYIEPPLLVSGRKFHIRTYVLCVGNIDVYVYKNMLALFAMNKYQSNLYHDLDGHLTNTCRLEGKVDETEVVKLLDEIFYQSSLIISLKQVHEQIFQFVGECFQCVASELSFQALPNAFELFGFDFMISKDGNVWLLEANAEPDLKQTGQRLKDCVEGLIEGVMRLAVDKFATQMGRWDGRMKKYDIYNTWQKVYSKCQNL